MALTINDAKKLSTRPFSALALTEIATSDELLPLLPFVAKPGDGFSYTREKALPTFSFVSDTGTSITESTGTDEVITVANRQAVEDFYIPNFAAENLSAEVMQFEAQAAKKFKAAGRLLSSKFINGGNVTGITVGAFDTGAYVDALVSCSSYMDSNRDGPGSLRYVHTGTLLEFRAPGDADYGAAVACASDGSYTLYSHNPSKWIRVTLDVSDATTDQERLVRFTSSTYEFDGLEKLVTTGQTRSSTGSNGDALDLAILDELIDAVKVGSGQPVFLMNAALRRKFKTLMRAAGGNDMMDLASGVRVPEYNGIPILRNDNIASDESKGSGSTLSSVYLTVLGEDEGVYMGALGGGEFNVDADPMEASLMGFRLYDLGQIQASAGNVRGGRLAWYGGLAMGSTLSCARAKEIVTA